MLRASFPAADVLDQLVGPDFVGIFQRTGWFLITFAIVVLLIAIASHLDARR